MPDPNMSEPTTTLTDAETLDLFKACGALKTGHFILTSGRHSDAYFEKFDVMRWPQHVARLGQSLALRATAALMRACL
jgi:orotate phosphoribosyltransferase